MKKKYWLKQARDYINSNKSFRLFENETDIPADQAGEIWSLAAQQLNRGEYSRRDFRVTWTIDLDAKDESEAARQAMQIMRNPKSTATVFEVEPLNCPQTEAPVVVDLQFLNSAEVCCE